MTRATYQFVATIKADGIVIAHRRVTATAATEDIARSLAFARLGKQFPHATATLTRREA